MAAYVELYMDQGASLTNTLTITDDVTNAPVNISGYTLTSQMRRSYYSANGPPKDEPPKLSPCATIISDKTPINSLSRST